MSIPWSDERPPTGTLPQPIPIGAPVTLCGYHTGTTRTFLAHNPHADPAALRRAMWHGCCRYWTARGIPGWWT